MRTAILLSLLLTSVGVAHSQANTSGEKTMPAMVTNARWVLVRTLAGEQYARNITPEDREAIAEVQRRIEDWGHYKLAYKEQDADIILVVRRGAIASAKPGVIIGSGTGFPAPVPGIGMSTETGPKDDLLAVYDAHFGIDSAPLWRKIQRGGLLNEMPLFKEFKRAVEAAKKP